MYDKVYSVIARLYTQDAHFNAENGYVLMLFSFA